jgi:hypothetical protein
VEDELLGAAAKRFRVNVAKIAESVAAEFATKQQKREQRRAAAVGSAQRAGRKSTNRKDGRSV